MPLPTRDCGNLNELIQAIDRWPNHKLALCYGDSWFQFPGFKSADLQQQLVSLYKKTIFLDYSVAGRESSDYKKNRRIVSDALSGYEFDVLLVSMGGNDIVGKEFAEFVKFKDDSQDPGTMDWGTVPPQVRDHIRLSAFESGLKFLRDDYKEMFERRSIARPKCEVVVHNYDYIWPSDRPFKLGPVKSGPWVKPSLDLVGLTDPADQRIVSSWLIDQFTRMLVGLASMYPRVRVVNSAGTLTRAAQWKDEIHPTQSGFRKIAKEAWAPVLADLLA